MDKTDLTGLFDLSLQFASPPVDRLATDSPYPTLHTAIQEQLGLKLESVRGHVQVLVVDRVQEPSEN